MTEKGAERRNVRNWIEDESLIWSWIISFKSAIQMFVCLAVFFYAKTWTRWNGKTMWIVFGVLFNRINKRWKLLLREKCLISRFFRQRVNSTMQFLHQFDENWGFFQTDRRVQKINDQKGYSIKVPLLNVHKRALNKELLKKTNWAR